MPLQVPSVDWEMFASGSRRRPTKLGPAGSFFPLSGEKVFDILLKAAAASTGPRQYLAFYDARGASKTNDRTMYPLAEDRTLESYFSRLENSNDEVQICLSKCETFSYEAFQGARELLYGLFAQVGLPVGVDTDMFIGNYANSAAGIHCEPVSVFSIILVGRKRYFFWPAERFSGEVNSFGCGTIGSSNYNYYREDATMIEADPGDIVYWPGGEWHIAASQGWTATFNINLKYWHHGRADFVDVVNKLLNAQLGRAGYASAMIPANCSLSDLPSHLANAREQLSRRLGNPDVADSLIHPFLRQCSACGFEIAPPQRTVDGAAARKAFLGDRRFPIIAYASEKDTVVAANGHIMRVPNAKGILETIEAINSGATLPMEVASLKGGLTPTEYLLHFLIATKAIEVA